MSILKLVSPLKCELYNGEEDTNETMTDREATEYIGLILGQIKREEMPEETERGLMTYYSARGEFEPGAGVARKVRAARPTVEIINGKLTGVCYCAIAEPLNDAEQAALIDFITGQYSDGWGEGFEQRPITSSDGWEMYVSFWNSGKDWALTVA